MLIKSKGKRQWLTDERQRDEKSPAHPAREFGHEPIVKGTYNPLTSAETEEQILLRFAERLSSSAPGCFMTSTVGGRTVKLEVVSFDVPQFKFTVRQGGKVLQEGPYAV